MFEVLLKKVPKIVIFVYKIYLQPLSVNKLRISPKALFTLTFKAKLYLLEISKA